MPNPSRRSVVRRQRDRAVKLGKRGDDGQNPTCPRGTTFSVNSARQPRRAWRHRSIDRVSVVSPHEAAWTAVDVLAVLRSGSVRARITLLKPAKSSDCGPSERARSGQG
jgi:hypothetical protein